MGPPAEIGSPTVLMSPVPPTQVPAAYYPPSRPMTPAVNHHAMMPGPPTQQPPHMLPHRPHGEISNNTLHTKYMSLYKRNTSLQFSSP